MKRLFLSLGALAMLVSSCDKNMTIEQLQEINKGSIIWPQQIDSIEVQEPGGYRQMFRSFETSSLRDSWMRFDADGTGWRFQGKEHFIYEPDVDTIKFQWEMVPTETNKFRMWGGGQFNPAEPYNEVLLSVDKTHTYTTFHVTGRQAFLTYYLHRKWQ